MSKTKRNIVLALALCGLLLPMTVRAKDLVERPFKLHSERTIIVDLRFYPICPWWIESESGEATHLGLYTNSGEGTVDLRTGESTGSGEITAANGDIVYWDGYKSGDTLIMTYTGGTGRFEGASGSVTIAFTTVAAGPDPEYPWLYRITFSFSGTGTITY